MWKTLYESVQGTSHRQTGLPCQDSCAARLVELEAESVLVLACSDGAGSATYADVGSSTACQTLVDLVSAELRADGALRPVDVRRGRSWLCEARRSLALAADQREAALRELACTLLFAVLGERGAAFGQIGDGAIVLLREGNYQAAFWPQSGEYINSTNFVTHPRYDVLAEFAWFDARVDEVALISDGLQMVGLDFANQRVHAPFFEPLFKSLRARADAGALVEPMRAFLNSAPLNQRTDDDKTLMLATRLAPST